jgi:O-antigen/teichoic acid export membrane protein
MAGHLSGASWTAVRSLAVHSAGIGLAFLVQVAVANRLGTVEFGLFAWTMAVVNSVVVLARAGADTATLRYGAASVASGELQRFGAIVRMAQRRTLRLSLAVAPLLAVALFVPRRDVPGMATIAVACALWFPLLALNGVRQAATLARGWVVRSYLPETIVRPAILFGGVALMAVVASPDARAAVIAAGAGTLVAYGVGRYWIQDALAASRRHELSDGERRDWSQAAAGLFWLTAAYAVLAQADLLVFGALAPLADVGVFSAAKQLASVVLLGLLAIQSGLSPAIAAAHASGDRAGLASTTSAVAWAGLAFAAATGLVAFVGADALLGLFGHDYRQGRTALWVLLLAQMVVAVNGPAGIVASMTGHHAAATRAYVSALVIVVLGTVALYHAVGLLAPALASLVAAAWWTTTLRLHVRRTIGVDTRPRWVDRPRWPGTRRAP